MLVNQAFPERPARGKGYLTCYTEIGTMPIDNNLLQRDIRICATGRKSWLFSASDALVVDNSILIRRLSAVIREDAG